MGALALTAPVGHLLSQERQQWPPLVREAAAHVSQAQGYQGYEPQDDPVREEQRERGREHAERAHLSNKREPTIGISTLCLDHVYL